MSKALNPPIKWHGGKHYLAKKIIALMPPHERYVEPYCGGCAVLLAKDPEGIAEFVGDANGELINFWRVLARPTSFEQLRRMLQATPLSDWYFNNALEESESLYHTDFGPDATRAYKFFVRARMSRQGLAKDYCTPTSRTRRGMNEQVSSWLTAIDGMADIHERLRRVEIMHRPAIDVIAKLDSPKTVFYLDSPYLHETRTTKNEYGEHEMTPEQHRDQLYQLTTISGKFLMSGYRSELYDKFATENGWHRTEFELPNNASARKKKERKTECVWTNYEPVS